MRRHLSSSAVDRLILVAHGRQDPTNDEWERHLALVKQHGITSTMMLVHTQGGAPTPRQRCALEDLLAHRFVPVAVVSAMWHVQARVWMRSLFDWHLRAFPESPQGFQEALSFLGIPASRRQLVEQHLRDLVSFVREEQEMKQTRR